MEHEAAFAVSLDGADVVGHHDDGRARPAVRERRGAAQLEAGVTDRGDLVELDLARLDSVAAEWASVALKGDFGTACRNHGLDWVRDVSASAKQKYSEDYLRSYAGRPIMLGPHFRRDGRQLVRVYCFLDEDERRVVVGHVGRHLRDTMSACLMVANERIHQTNATLLLIAKEV